MKGIIIFDQLNDIIYIKVDHTLHNHLFNLCLREGLTVNEHDNYSDGFSSSNINALVQLFSPLVTSQRIMLTQFNNPYTAVHSQDGTIMTFAEELGYLFLAVGNEVTESLATVQKRLHVFLRLVKLLCGPAFNSLKLSVSGGLDRQKMLGRLMDTWEDLRKEELAYLIEAVERLLVNQYLSANCIKILENVLDKVQRSLQEAVASHAFLLVNTKLLALFSSRNSSELITSDILTLIMLAHTYHPSCRVEPPRSPRRTPSPSIGPLQTDETVTEGETVKIKDEPKKANNSLQVPLFTDGDESSDSEAFFSPCGTPPSMRTIEKLIPRLETLVSDREAQSGLLTVSQSSSMEEIADLLPNETEYTKDILFLRTSSSSHSPHSVYTIKVMDGVALIIICNVGKCTISGTIIQMLKILHDCQIFKQPEQGKQILDILESNFKRLLDGIKKIKNEIPDIETLSKNLAHKWEVVKKNGIQDYLKSSTSRFMTSKLETSVTSFMDSLCEGFKIICLPESSVSLPLNSDNTTTLVDVQAFIRFNLADYADYLRIKSFRNVTITSYMQEFPGLVYFIYVNRTNNHVTVPTMDGENIMQLNNFNLTNTLKEKIFQMIEFTRIQLQLGHFAIVWKDNHFHYSYFLWFEDAKGEPLTPRASLLGLRNFPPPGILCGDFFKMLKQECFQEHSSDNIQCYELLSIHLSTATPAYIVEHVRRLAAKIWDLTGIGRSLMDIL